MEYETVIGLEVHVQLKTASKMFCGCKNEYGGDPNTQVCPVCLGMPGAMPVPNQQAILKTVQTGLMLECDIADICKFDRKNYFYPDMPKNYQISQYDMPFCEHGGVTLQKYGFPKEFQNDPSTSEKKHIRLVRIHLEEDVAKSTHFEHHSTIDFNRAGSPLLEIVTEPDISSGEEAYSFLNTLRQILVYGGISDADMEKGQLRCDVNISVRPKGSSTLGTKCELKNLNSISAVRRAIHFEADRQVTVLSKGGSISQETRRWDDNAGTTSTMRSKEDAHDYRYFPEPDLLPIRTDQGLREEASALLPELPAQKKQRLIDDFQLSEYQAEVLTSDQLLSDYYEKAAADTPHKPAVANLIINDFLATTPDLATTPLPPAYFGQVADLLESGKINSKQGKQIIAEMIAQPRPPSKIVEEKGLTQITDTSALEEWCQKAIEANPKSVADFQSGKGNAINALKGFVMKNTKGKANPALVDEILKKQLENI